MPVFKFELGRPNRLTIINKMKRYNKNNNPLISVIIPVYNGESFVGEAIESILNQTYSNFELIIVNDLSTDKTSEILEFYRKRDKRIKIIQNNRQLFLSGSLNKALKQVTGKYIARMDSDDVSLPQRFSLQVKMLEENPNLVAVGGQEEVIDSQGNITAVKNFPVNPKICYNLFMNFIPIQPPLLMARAAVMKKLRYDTVISKHDDIDMLFKLLKYGRFSNVDEIIFQYRVRNGSSTHSKAKEVFFMAFNVRIRAIINQGYRPNIFAILIAIVELFVVLIMPSKYLVPLFEFLRYSHRRSLNFFRRIQLAFQN